MVFYRNVDFVSTINGYIWLEVEEDAILTQASRSRDHRLVLKTSAQLIVAHMCSSRRLRWRLGHWRFSLVIRLEHNGLRDELKIIQELFAEVSLKMMGTVAEVVGVALLLLSVWKKNERLSTRIGNLILNVNGLHTDRGYYRVRSELAFIF